MASNLIGYNYGDHGKSLTYQMFVTLAQFSRSQQDLMCENIAFYNLMSTISTKIRYVWLSNFDIDRNIVTMVHQLLVTVTQFSRS